MERKLLVVKYKFILQIARRTNNMASQKKVTVNGVEYKLQHPGALWYFEMIDRTRNRTGLRNTAEYYNEILENVVVSPQVTISDFGEDIMSVFELVREANAFLGGGTTPRGSEEESKE